MYFINKPISSIRFPDNKSLRSRLTPFLSLILLLFPFGSSAQPSQGQARLDSLLAELPRMKEDTNGARLLVSIAQEYEDMDPATSLVYTERFLALSQKIGFRYGIYQAYNSLGNNARSEGDYPKAYEHYVRSLKLAEELGRDDQAAGTLLNLGLVLANQDDLPGAIDFYKKVIPLAQKLNDPRMLSYAYANIAGIYNTLGSYHECLENIKLAVQAGRAVKDSVHLARLENSLGYSYGSVGQYDEALPLLEQGLRFFQRRNLKRFQVESLGSLGDVHMSIANDTTHTTAGGSSPSARAINAQKGLRYLESAVALATTLEIRNKVMAYSLALSKAYASVADSGKAYLAFQAYNQLKDSIFTKENSEAISKLETKRLVELKQKDIEIARLEVEKKRNERWFFIAGIVMLLGITGALFRSFRKQQQNNVVITYEKKRSDDLLLNILPAEVAEELKDNGQSAARQFDQATILFTDFKDFTALSERLTPTELVEELNTCFKAFDHIITARGIEKIKTIGDAYMCAGGLPDPGSSSPHAVVLAALEMQAFMTSRKSERDAQGLPAFEMRVGIHTGPVVAGIVGVKKFAYDIWGDTVNTASRMESSGEVGQVNISESTYALVREQTGSLFHFIPRGKVQAKGKGEVEMYFVRRSLLSP